MNINQLIYFSEVVRVKSINSAAKNLFIAQPSLSASISSLEKELGTKLLKRTQSGIIPTQIGLKVYEDSQIIINLINTWLQNSDPDSLSGEVHLLASPSACSQLLIDLIVEIQSTHPNSRIFLYETKVQNILSQLNSGFAKIALGSIPLEENASLFTYCDAHNLKLELLGNDLLGVLINQKHPLVQKETLLTSDLRELTITYYSDVDDPITSKYFLKYFDVKNTYRLGNREQIFQAILENNAVGIFPQKSTQSNFYIKNDLITFLPIHDYPFYVSYYLIYPKNTLLLSSFERYFIDVLKQRFFSLFNL